MTVEGGGSIFYIDDGVNQRQTYVASGGQTWNSVVVGQYVYVDRTNNVGWAWEGDEALPGWGSFDWSILGANSIVSPDPLRFFGFPVASLSEAGLASQILYCALWFGANATLMGGGRGSLADHLLTTVLWPHELGRVNDSPYHGLCNVAGNTYGRTSALVGDDPLTGICVGDFPRQNNIESLFAWRYDPQLSRRSKIAAVSQCDAGETYDNMVLYSDRVQDAAWSKTT